MLVNLLFSTGTTEIVRNQSLKYLFELADQPSGLLYFKFNLYIIFITFI